MKWPQPSYSLPANAIKSIWGFHKSWLCSTGLSGSRGYSYTQWYFCFLNHTPLDFFWIKKLPWMGNKGNLCCRRLPFPPFPSSYPATVTPIWRAWRICPMPRAQTPNCRPLPRCCWWTLPQFPPWAEHLPTKTAALFANQPKLTELGCLPCHEGPLSGLLGTLHARLPSRWTPRLSWIWCLNRFPNPALRPRCFR